MEGINFQGLALEDAGFSSEEVDYISTSQLQGEDSGLTKVEIYHQDQLYTYTLAQDGSILEKDMVDYDFELDGHPVENKEQ